MVSNDENLDDRIITPWEEQHVEYRRAPQHRLFTVLVWAGALLLVGIMAWIGMSLG